VLSLLGRELHSDLCVSELNLISFSLVDSSPFVHSNNKNNSDTKLNFTQRNVYERTGNLVITAVTHAVVFHHYAPRDLLCILPV
jgi:hypothetical protein